MLEMIVIGYQINVIIIHKFELFKNMILEIPNYFLTKLKKIESE